MKNHNLKIALLGVSHWHVPLYLAGLPENSVIAVSDPDKAIADRYAQQYGCPAYQDYREMINTAKPDFVFAFAPHNQMKEVSMFLMENGVPFSMEKPMGVNASEVEMLWNDAEKKSAFCSIPFVWRYSDTVNDLKNKYLSSAIRHMSYKFIAGPPARYLESSPWMLSRETAGGGCMTNLGVHFIDMALFLTDNQAADVLASMYHFDKAYDIETYATSMLKLDTGASLLIESGYAYPMSENAKRENRWTIVTDNGYYTLADNQLESRELGKTPSVVNVNTDSDVYYAIYVKTTLDDYINGNKPRASLREMLAVRRILDDMDTKAYNR